VARFPPSASVRSITRKNGEKTFAGWHHPGRVARKDVPHSHIDKALPWVVPFMGKIRRGDHVFLTWKGDHAPRHVHVYKKGKMILKWDLENGKAMRGRPTKRVLALIRELQAEGLL